MTRPWSANGHHERTSRVRAPTRPGDGDRKVAIALVRYDQNPIRRKLVGRPVSIPLNRRQNEWMTGGEDDKAANDAVLPLNETCQFRRGGKPPAKTIPPARIVDVAELIVERPTRLEGIRRLLPDEARLPIQNRLVVPVREKDEPCRPWQFLVPRRRRVIKPVDRLRRDARQDDEHDWPQDVPTDRLHGRPPV